MRTAIGLLLRTADVPNAERAEELWAEYRSGGPDGSGAFATLLAWYGGAIYRRIWGFVRSDAADDLFQDVFARLHRERSRLATFADAQRWLRAVAVTRCVDAHRRATRRAAREPARAVSESVEDQTAVRLDLDDALRAALAKLSTRERHAVALVYFEGLTRQDAAAQAGVHRDTFAKTLDSALARLRTALATTALVGAAATTASLEAALTARPLLVTHLRLAELAAAAWDKGGTAPALWNPAWLAGKKLLLAGAVAVGLLTVSLIPATRNPHMPATKLGPRLGLERLEGRETPSVGYSTALPGAAFGSVVDAAGNTYVTTSGTSNGVYKFDPSGRLLASNPSVPAGGAGIAADAAGDVYLHRGAVVTELDPTLQRTLFTVTLPGAVAGSYGGPDGGTAWFGAVAVAGGKIYVVGSAKAGLPTTPTAFQPSYPGASSGRASAYLAVIDPASAAPYHLTYCTYLGGTTLSRGDAASGVAVDAAGVAYLTGSTASSDFPTTSGAFQRAFKGGSQGYNVFVAKVDPTQAGAASLVYSSYLGGSGRDGYLRDAGAAGTGESSPSIAVDGAGSAYVAGSTSSADFPTTAGAFQRTFAPVAYYAPLGPVGHAFVTKFTPTGGGLAYSTLLGGSQMDGAGGIAVDAAGHAWVTGWTRSADFPTANPLQPNHAAGADPSYPNLGLNSDAFVAELDTSGGSLLFSTYWGGSGNDYGMGIGLDGTGNVFVTGTAGAGFPTTPGAYQKTGSGFVLKITR